MTLSTVDVIRYAAAAGFPRDTLVTVAGIAWRESRNNPGAVGDVNNPAPGCRSLGLMQINVCPNYNNRGIWFREQSETDPGHVLFDPGKNMRAAKELYDDRGFRPWTTYRAGIPAPDTARIEREIAAAGGLDAVLAGVPSAATLGSTGGGVSGAVASGAGALLDGFRFFDALLDPNTWKRAGFIFGGVVLALGAVVLISQDARNTLGKRLAGVTQSPGLDPDAPELPPAPPTTRGAPL